MGFTLSGKIIDGDLEILDGWLRVEDGKIEDMGEGRCKSDLEGIILPAFINAHTHIGDSLLKDFDYLPLEKLVGPRGVKHRILDEAEEWKMREAMNQSILQMVSSGTILFCDFREGGSYGARILRETAKSHSIDVKIFGRPSDSELEMELVDGIGISSTLDYGWEELCELRELARKNKVGFGIHAGEGKREDIEDAISLEPDYLVHLTQAKKSDLKKVERYDIPVIVCPRSNFVTGVGSSEKPPVKLMLEYGIKVGVGTDNVMLNSPDLFSELEWISKIFLHDDRKTLELVKNNADIFGERWEVKKGGKADLLVVSEKTLNMQNVHNPISGIVRRACSRDLIGIIKDGILLNEI